MFVDNGQWYHMFVVQRPLLYVVIELCEKLSFNAGVLVLVPFRIPIHHDSSWYITIHVYHRRICEQYIHTKSTQNRSPFSHSHMVPTKLHENLHKRVSHCRQVIAPVSVRHVQWLWFSYSFLPLWGGENMLPLRGIKPQFLGRPLPP
jgi:hypothetical protein